MTVHAVRGRRELAEFVNLPWRLYRGDPNWIAPLKASVRAMLDQQRHPFYAGGRDAEIELFLARDGREVVGRVAAIMYNRHNEFHRENIAFFGFFESVDSAAVAAELLGAVESWARERGVTAVRGPANPSQNYECGLLIEGFDRPPVLMMTYNPPSYVGLVEGAGYAKAKDLYAYISQVHGASLERLERLADRTRRRNPALSTRGANLKDFVGEVRLAKEIYNAAWEDNWGFVPVTDAEFDWLAKELKPIVLPELVRFAFVDGEPVGLLLCLPDWNPVMGDLDGSPWRHPLRTLKHVLRSKASNQEGLRLVLLGVKDGFRDRGIEGVLLGEGLRIALDTGYTWCEYSWILEDNELTKRAVRLMDGELYKVYRMYQKAL
jgi:GNAT superfamily N-acetyltransferase